MQKLWQLQVGWDETLPQDIHTMWLNFNAQLQALNTISVPRSVCCDNFDTTQLHGCCDASEAAYGSCLYLRTSTASGQVAVRLLCARSRVAPLKTISVPRLELQAAVKDISEEQRSKRVLILTTAQDFELLERYSLLNRMIRVRAYCLRLCKNAQCNKNKREIGNLEAMELSGALIWLLKLTDVRDFSCKIREIKQSRKIPNKGKLCSLNPFLDQHGLLKVGGRLTNAPIPFDQKHPIILAPNNPLITLLIAEEHKKLLHAWCQAVIASLRTRYWPLSGKSTVKGVLRKCIKCFRAKPVTTEYIMGNLPTARVTPNRPFFVCGVDYAGPYNLGERARSHVTYKAYICIFVCFVTKAIHIELAHDLSTDASLNSLRRFLSRCSKCQHIYSDNGIL